ncbi:translation initiation factor 2 [Rhizobium sp. NTR19]|uniref:Translation initiation factor 2 n=1 Tax=Neorhizobium turbinariae TaxID=2937795 RepID=A0ABT0IMM0_9HYPH|nr:translation initiation factor 2 [Neorhizobium turbinariae]MCK8779116.1 translation initiation factor 2 [Neorhizobium turbinariae]
MKIQIATIAALAAALSSCGSISRGTSENVVISAMPTDAKVSTSLGHSCPQSPCTIKVERKAEFTVFAEKEGYKPGRLDVKTKISDGGAAGFAGNVLVGGVIGMGVDAATGAALDHYPNPAYVVLEPMDPKNPKTPTMAPPVVEPKKKTTTGTPSA